MKNSIIPSRCKSRICNLLPPFQNGKLTSMSGEYYDIKMHQAPSISRKLLLKAVNHIGASKYLWESPEMHQK
jgi:hypothetical protein